MIFKIFKHIKNPDFFLKGKFSAFSRILALSCFLIFFYGQAKAEDEKKFSDLAENDGKTQWQLFADRIVYEKDGIVMLEGDAEIIGKDKNLSADIIKYDTVSEVALARGNVRMNWGKDTVSSEALKFDIREETGTIFDGHLFVEENHFYLKSSRLEKKGPQQYSADQVIFSSCDGDNKDWQIFGRDLDITIDGYGSVSDMSLMAKDMPLVYSPYFFFPVKTKRQSGFLIPEFGFSTRKGAEYQQPFYWAVNDTSDATFYAHEMTLRGFKTGAEYRYVLDKESLGILMMEYLDDKKTDTGTTASSSDWGFTHDSHTRSNQDRYWLRMKADQALPAKGVSAKLDIDYVSDQDYLLEFDGRKTGFDDTSGIFSKYFGRQIDGQDEAVRLNRLNIAKIAGSFSINADAAWYDDVIARTKNLDDETLKKLPVMQFGTTLLPFPDASVIAGFGGNYTNFYSEDGKKGDRMSVATEIHSPKQIGNFLIIDPSASLNQTLWIDRSDEKTGNKSTHCRTMYDIGIDIGSRLTRTYETSFAGIPDIVHNFEPKIGYFFVPDKDQDNLPDFDGNDVIQKKKNLVWSVTNIFTERENSPEKQASGSYNRLCRLYIEQGYDVNKAENEDDEPFTPILTRLSFTPYPNLTLETDSEWSVYDYDFVSRNIKSVFKTDSGHTAMLEYRFTKKDEANFQPGIESFRSGIEFGLTSAVRIYGLLERDILNEMTIETIGGFRYSSQCWSADVNYTDKGNEEKISMIISLSGLGEFGIGAPQF